MHWYCGCSNIIFANDRNFHADTEKKGKFMAGGIWTRLQTRGREDGEAPFFGEARRVAEELNRMMLKEILTHN
jgi:hypothetical protein